MQDLQICTPVAAPVSACAAAPETVEKPVFGLFEEEPEATELTKPVSPEATSPRPLAGDQELSACLANTATAKAIRVDLGQLDKSMNLVGELVLARNQIVQFSAQTEESSLIAAS